MPYTWADFERDYIKEHFPQLTREERREIVQSLPAEERREVLESLPPEEQQEFVQLLPLEQRLAGLSPEQIRQYLEQLSVTGSAKPRKQRRKK